MAAIIQFPRSGTGRPERQRRANLVPKLIQFLSRDTRPAAATRKPTRYELIAEKGETKFLIGYCAKRTERDLLVALFSLPDAMPESMGSSITILRPVSKYGVRLLKNAPIHAELERVGDFLAAPLTADDWSVRFSGRTQRECIGSELDAPRSLHSAGAR